MARRKIPDWIAIDSSKQVVRCGRCKTEKPLGLPAPIDAFVKEMQAFGIRHENCEAGGGKIR